MGDRTRTYRWDDPLAGLAELRSLSGIEALRRIQRGDLAAAPIAQTLGFELTEVEEGRATFTVEPREFHYNPIGVVHGGLALALLDSAMGCAFQSTLPAGVAYTTIELKANFVRPLTFDTGRVACIGEIVHPGRTVGTAEGRIVDEAGKLYAHGTATLLVVTG